MRRGQNGTTQLFTKTEQNLQIKIPIEKRLETRTEQNDFFRALYI